MVEIAKKYVEELPQRVEEVESAYRYFKENNQRYEEGRTFIFKTTITEELRSTLVNIEWPIFEVNLLESFMSRLAGEFAKQMPSPTVNAVAMKSDDPRTVALCNFLEGRLRYIFESPQSDNAKKQVYTEAMSGGFSAAKLHVDYINPRSFEQDVMWDKVYDPTLCYFDPIARKNHKGDGRYCGEIVPYTEEEFKDNWPGVDINSLDYSRDALTAGNLHWFYTESSDNTLRKVIYVADHYVKKDIQQKILLVKLPNLKPLIMKVMQAVQSYIMMKKQQQQQAEQAQQSMNPQPQQMQQQQMQQKPPQQPMQSNNMMSPYPSTSGTTQGNKPQPYFFKAMTQEEYDTLCDMWKEHTMLPVPPVVRERMTTITEIWHYRFTRDRLLERPQKTNFPILPIVFFDGNSHVLGNKQMTRPYHYQAMDAQKMKNITGIAMMNAIENFPQTRFLMDKQSIPEEPAYQETIKNPQRPSSAFVYNGMGQANDGKPLNPPIPLNFAYFSGELIQLYNDLDRTIQMILGNFDQQMGIQEKELSGIAIQEAQTQSNNAAMPYINNFMDAMNQIASGIIQMIPKLMRTPRTLPIVNKEGLHEALMVNDPTDDLLSMDYDAMDLEVVVKSSVNFEIQKDRTFGGLTTLMALPDPNPWKSFFGGTAATDLLDNMTLRNQDNIKQKFVQFQKSSQQQQEQNQKMALITNPAVAQLFDTMMTSKMKEQELQLQSMQQKMDQQVEGMKMIQTLVESIAKIRESADKVAIQKSEVDAENRRTASESAANALDAAIAVDRHLGEQFDRQAEHLYRQVELGDKLNETQIKREAISQKDNGSTGNERG